MVSFPLFDIVGVAGSSGTELNKTATIKGFRKGKVEGEISTVGKNTKVLGKTEELTKTVIAGIVGFAIGAVITLVFGHNPVTAYTALFRGGFGSVYGLSESLANAVPLILTGPRRSRRS